MSHAYIHTNPLAFFFLISPFLGTYYCKKYSFAFSINLKSCLGYQTGTEKEKNHREMFLPCVCERRDVYSLFICSGGK